MTFETNDYLGWYIPRMMRGDGAINLHASGVPLVDPSEIDWPKGETMMMFRHFEQRLSQWLDVPAAELVFTPGATGGTLLTLLELGHEGGEIVVENPIYEPMLRQAERLGTVRRLERRIEDEWRFSVDEAQQLIGDDTSLVMITEPHNPSGVFSPRDDVLQLARAAAEHGATLLINEVYLGYTDRPSYHGAADNIVVVASLSKLLGAYWARAGWLSAPKPVAEKLRLAHWNMGMPCMPGAQAGLGFLEQARERREAARQLAADGIEALDAWVAALPAVSWVRPHGGGFACIGLPVGTNDVTLAEQLHDERDVLVVPGIWFGAPG
ncbi:MAG: pyridoxal phosphate-dependent aminotransferase, partial [Deltaproteobacteria bacterium]|nr:pyridoxal phosphate-dependent aminotransferase [Deltaproteobacteria bacterium]